MRGFVRSWFNVSADPAVQNTCAARDDQQQKLAQLEAQKEELQKIVDENRLIGERQRKQIQAKLNERAKQAEPALDVYEGVSIGKIVYDQIGQLLGKITDNVNHAARSDMDNYGYRSKQFFSCDITADTLSRHLVAKPNEPFDHLVVPLMQEMSDSGMDPSPVEPLLEFAHEGSIDDRRMLASVLQLREALSRHRVSVGSSYASGKRLAWESILDTVKFSRPAAGFENVERQLSLAERADRCAESIEAATKKGEWATCVGNINELWSLLAPTIRGGATSPLPEVSGGDRTALVVVPLLTSMFEVRTAAEQRLAIDFYENFRRAQSARHQAAFTMKMFDHMVN